MIRRIGILLSLVSLILVSPPMLADHGDKKGTISKSATTFAGCNISSATASWSLSTFFGPFKNSTYSWLAGAGTAINCLPHDTKIALQIEFNNGVIAYVNDSPVRQDGDGNFAYNIGSIGNWDSIFCGFGTTALASNCLDAETAKTSFHSDFSVTAFYFWCSSQACQSDPDSLASGGGGGGGVGSEGGSSGGSPDPIGGILTRTDVSLINVTGEVGGPFTSGSGFLDLSNTGDQSLYFSLNYDSLYLDIFPSSGVLSPGQTRRVSVDLSSEVNTVLERTFYPSISFKNITNNQGSANYVATVNVLPSTRFLVSEGRLETVRIVSQDPVFSPPSKEYILENQSSEAINYSVASEVNWLNLSSTTGTLAAGENTIITVSLNATAMALGSNHYLTPIMFTDTTHGINVRRYADVKVFNDVSGLQVTPSTPAQIVEVSSVNGQNQNQNLTLSNSGSEPISYSVESNVGWMTIVGNSGSLPGNSSSNLTVWPTPNNGLALGEYTGQLTISDTQNPTGATTIDVTLIKRAAQESSIVVTPVDPVDIPFELETGGKNTYIKAYEIRNLGETSISYTMTSDQYWARVYRLTDFANTTPGSDVILIPLNKSAYSEAYSVADLDCPCEIPATGSLRASAAAIVYVRIRSFDRNDYQANLTVTNTTNGLGNTSIPITIMPVQPNLPGVPENFQVTRIVETNHLVWDLNYVNVQHYEIEHSLNGVSFATYHYAPQVREWDSLHLFLNNLQRVWINDTAGYYYRVRACNAAGCGPYTAALQSPLEPVSASNWGIVASQDLYSDRIRVRWEASGLLSSQFQHFRSESPTGPKTQLARSQTVQPTDSGYYYFWDINIQPGQKYFYWVRSCANSSGADCETDFSFYAAGVSYRAPANLFASSPVQLSASMFEGALQGLPASPILNIVNVGMLSAGWSLVSDQSWLNPRFTSGALVGDQETQVGLIVNSAAGLLSVGTHTANLQFTNTTNGAGNFNFAFSLTIQASPIPEAPDNLASSVDYYSDRVELEWQPVAGTSYYQITRIAEGQGILVRNHGGVIFSDTIAVVDVLYQYMVSACNSSGCSSSVSSEGRVILDDDDGDTLNNAFDPDDDNDGVLDEWDKFPLDPAESIDTDNDLLGNNADGDDDNDGVPDLIDLFPFDGNDWADNDQDGIGDNADEDDDNDGIPDVSDDNPLEFDDIDPPIISVPDDLVIDATGLLTEVFPGSAIASDQIDSSPIISNDYNGPLPPGAHEINWVAVDGSGNFATDKQLIHINPLVSIQMNFSVIEGQNLQIPVSLNGDAPEYPVVISFSLAGSAIENEDYDISPANHVVVIESGREAVIDLSSRDDAQFELSETITLTINNDLKNASLGSADASIITLLQGNVAPTASIGMSQNGQISRIFARDEGLVSMMALITELNPEDTHVLNWTGTDVELIDTDLSDEVFSFDPSSLLSGTFNVTLKVADQVGASVSISTLIQITSSAPILTSIDSDSDGISDEVEGDQDTDSDGIPDYLDRVVDTNRLQSYQGDSFVLQADPGLKLSLGDSAFSAAVPGANINESDIEQTASGLYQSDIMNSVGGIFDFNIENIAMPGSSVNVVLPLSSPVPAAAVYRKYTDITGWQDFIEDASNQVRSALGFEGSCPVSGNSTYVPGLIQGYWCVQLTIEDGGPNDADGLINAVIKDPGTVATFEKLDVGLVDPDDSNNQEPESSTGDESDDSSGAGAFGFYLLILLTNLFVYQTRGLFRFKNT